MGYLVLVRHGESMWNAANKFTGWVDVPLSEKGINEAQLSAKKLEGLGLDVAFTSKLERAQQTLLIILARQEATGIFLHDSGKRKRWSNVRGALDKHEIHIHSSDALNERFYGRLQGMDKDAARREHGEKQVFIWRRSYNIRPPEGESLKDVVKRVLPYFKKSIMPFIKKGKNVIIAAHGNSLRALIKHLDRISDKDIPKLELPYGTPIVYKYAKGRLIKKENTHSFERPIHWRSKTL